jgi:NlpC/P60 family
MNRRHLKLAWIFALGLFAALLACPLRSTSIRLSIIALGGLVCFGMLLLIWRELWLRLPILLGFFLFLAFLCAPARSRFDHENLRQAYVADLKKYDGVKYVYGGENSLGLDCSGLVRSAMVKALRIYGTRRPDAGALRSSIRLWWRDCNAIDLGKGRTGDTFPIGTGEYAKLRDHDRIAPGDLAVTESGSHVLAYLGDETWIEADPTIGRTHIFSLTGQFAPLGDERVRFVRWRWLDPSESN